MNVHNKIREQETRARSLDSRLKVQARAAQNTETESESLTGAREELEHMSSCYVQEPEFTCLHHSLSLSPLGLLGPTPTSCFYFIRGVGLFMCDLVLKFGAVAS